MSTLTPSRIAAEVEYFAEREQAARDEAADAEYERRERAFACVTFDDVLEQIAMLPAAKKNELMALWDGGARDRRHFEWKFCSTFSDAVESAASVYLAQGN